MIGAPPGEGVVLANNPLAARLQRELSPQLRRHLADHLPEFMRPSSLSVIPRFPLTPNGKIDTRRLPRPTHVQTPAGQDAPAEAHRRAGHVVDAHDVDAAVLGEHRGDDEVTSEEVDQRRGESRDDGHEDEGEHEQDEGAGTASRPTEYQERDGDGDDREHRQSHQEPEDEQTRPLAEVAAERLADVNLAVSDPLDEDELQHGADEHRDQHEEEYQSDDTDHERGDRPHRREVDRQVEEPEVGAGRAGGAGTTATTRVAGHDVLGQPEVGQPLNHVRHRRGSDIQVPCDSTRRDGVGLRLELVDRLEVVFDRLTEHEPGAPRFVGGSCVSRPFSRGPHREPS